jgi:hypothetical protein
MDFREKFRIEFNLRILLRTVGNLSQTGVKRSDEGRKIKT